MCVLLNAILERWRLRASTFGISGRALSALWVIFVPSSMSIVYIAQSSLELEQHAFLPTKGATKNTPSEKDMREGHVYCQAPHSDALLHPGYLSVTLSPELAQL